MGETSASARRVRLRGAALFSLTIACSSASSAAGPSDAAGEGPASAGDGSSSRPDARESGSAKDGAADRPDVDASGDGRASKDGRAPPDGASARDSGSDAGASVADGASVGDGTGGDGASRDSSIDDPGSYTPAGYHLLWEDLFDTGTTPSTTLWSMYDSPGNGGNGLRRPRAFSIHDGMVDVLADMQNGQLVSGGMSANHSETYAYYEFRVRTDADPSEATDGVVLTWPDDGVWPEHGEEDIYETGTSATRDPFHTYIHYGSVGSTQYVIDQPSDAKAWHVMGMEWTATVINVYRDGAFVGKVTDPNAIPTVSHHMSIQLDAYTTSIAAPTHMYVDWVKVYGM